MKRSDFLKKAAIGTVAGVVGANTLLAQESKGKKTVYFHYLLFWLKPTLTAQEVIAFEQFFEGLKKLPYVKNLRYGTPAASSPRAVLDNTFTYNASMEFASLEELEAYGQLPGHIELVNKYKPFFERMSVHDTVYTY